MLSHVIITKDYELNSIYYLHFIVEETMFRVVSIVPE